VLRITAGHRRLCDGLDRRDALHVGAAGLIGLNLHGLLAAKAPPSAVQPKAKSLILFVIEGGPAHQAGSSAVRLRRGVALV
jgi:hypothetical protein